MNSLSFIIRDSDHECVQSALKQLCAKLGMTQAQTTTDCDLLAVHRNSDALQPADKQNTLAKGTAYVEYTTAALAWQVCEEGHYYGGLEELKARLRRLSPLGNRDDLHTVLSGQRLILSFLPSLALMLQGFLVVHWEAEQWPEGKNEDKIREAVQKAGWFEPPGEKESAQLQSLGSQLHRVRDQDWWQQLRLFLQEKSWDPSDVRLEEWRPDEPGHPPWSEDVKSLIVSLIEGGPIGDVELVASAYCAIADRLGASC